MKKLLPLIILCVFLTGCAASSALRFPPSRWLRDNDRIPTAEPKERWRYSYAVGESERYQLASFEKIESFIGVPKMVTGGNEEALNVNNFDEAPDSTWFTNRLGRFNIAASDIAKGTSTAAPFSLKDGLTVIWVSRGEVAPELIVEDSEGAHYLLLFDTAERPELATSAAMIANRILYAFGYNVPSSRIVNVDRAKLLISPNAATMTKYGEECPATSEDLDRIWNKAASDPRTGLARAAMIEDQEGIPIGPFSFSGKRSSDKNDRIRHEYRRELRGLRTFCAFLDCGAMVDEQTGDFFIVTDEEMGYLTHYILHTDNTLGTYKKQPVDPDKYDPAKWDPFVSNAAFNMATKRDEFWGAAILSNLSNDAIVAVVNEAKFSSKDKRNAMVNMLIDRRDKTVAYWLGKLSPLANFALSKDAGGPLLTFDDLLGGNSYRYRFRTERGRGILKEWTGMSDTNVRIDSVLINRFLKDKLYVLELQAKKAGDEWWLPPVDVFLKRASDGAITLMGIARRYR